MGNATRKLDGFEKHENFEISKKKQLEIIRADRHDMSETNAALKLCDDSTEEICEVLNYSAFGLLICTEDELKLNLKGNIQGTFIIDGIEIGTYALKVVRIESLHHDGYKIALELLSGTISIEKVRTVRNLSQILNSIKDSQQKLSLIPETFKRLTFEAKESLKILEKEIENMREERAFESIEELQHFESTLIPLVGNFLAELFNPAYEQLADSIKNIKGDAYPVCMEFFRSQLEDLLHQSPFSQRSLTRPLGYAGDFEMMNIIYRNEFAGRSLFGKCLHYYWMQHPEAQAVRNRSKYLNEKLFETVKNSSDKNIRCLSVACGPAKEIQLLIENQSKLDFSKITFDLLDQDLTALKHTQLKIRELTRSSGVNLNINYLNKAIKNIITSGLESAPYDLIYSAGLFDYFSDPVAQMAARGLFNKLNPGGRLVIGNFNLSTPNQFMMRLALDWNLIYRSHDDLKRLYGSLPGTFSIEEEPEGVNLFCVIQK